MKIILSPAKKMVVDNDTFLPYGLPVFLDQTEKILSWLKTLSLEELKNLWKCNDKLAEENFARIQSMNLRAGLSPALFSYDGIAYQYLSAKVLANEQLDYLQDHLRILSAFYGLLKPMDGVTPYRLEMQAKASIDGHRDLYDFWASMLYNELHDEDGIIINLASKEYFKCIEKFLLPEDRFITIDFLEASGDKLVTKGTYAKMARGQMVRFMAEKLISNPEDIKSFNCLGYAFREDLSSYTNFVFVKDL